VRGLARMVQVSPSHTLIDLSLTSLPPGHYEASIRASGDISQGTRSLGQVWKGEGREWKGALGFVEVDANGRGWTYLAQELSIWDIIGRGMIIQKGGTESVVGVIARSAGVWDNDKQVCSCSGKTVWEEREEQKGRGML